MLCRLACETKLQQIHEGYDHSFYEGEKRHIFMEKGSTKHSLPIITSLETHDLTLFVDIMASISTFFCHIFHSFTEDI